MEVYLGLVRLNESYKGMGDDLYMLGPGSGTIRRCGPVGVDVSLWSGL